MLKPTDPDPVVKAAHDAWFALVVGRLKNAGREPLPTAEEVADAIITAVLPVILDLAIGAIESRAAARPFHPGSYKASADILRELMP